MQKAQKILPFILTIMMVISIMPIPVSAFYKTSGTCGNNTRWTFDEDTGVLTFSGTGDIQDFFPDYSFPDGTWFNYRERITSVVVGDGITRIGRYTFENCTNLTSIVIPDSITSIGYAAFSGCYNLTNIPLGKKTTTIDDYAFVTCRGLTSITLPDGLKIIGNNAFSGCVGLTSIKIPDSVIGLGSDAFTGCDNLASVTIGNGIKTINEYTFSGCNSLKDVVLGNNVTTIGENAFSRCESLKEITIPESVTTIDKYAFSECASLQEITIPESVTTIDKCAFLECDSLQEIIVDENNQKYSNDEHGTLFNKDKSKIIQYPIGNTSASYTIPDSVTTIGDYSFSYCNNLTSVTIPDSVETIGANAFVRCSNLADIIIGEGVTKIGYNAMSNCTSLTSVTIPDSITIIDDYAFYYCRNLKSITISDSVTTIGFRAFESCNNLADVYYFGTVEQWNTIEIDSSYNGNDYLLKASIHYNSAKPFTGIKDNHFYKKDVMQKAYQLVEFEGDFYYIGDRHEIAIDKKVYIKEERTNDLTFADGTPITAGWYEFDENGKMVIVNGIVGNKVYKNNIQLKAYQLVEVDGDFYYIGDRHEIVKNKKVYIKAERLNDLTYEDGTPIQSGYYTFDENGKMIILDGIVGNKVYKNNVQLKAYQLVEVNGDFYYIGDRHEIVKDKKVYIKAERTNGLTFADGTPIQAGWYNFDADGKLIIE